MNRNAFNFLGLCFLAVLATACGGVGDNHSGQKQLFNVVQPNEAPKAKRTVYPNTINPDQIKPNTEEYGLIVDNEFLAAEDNPLSTFSIDVDNAAYANTRRFIDRGEKPPMDAVRAEEFINYFTYDYPQPKSKHPFTLNTEISDAPWNKKNKLIHIGLQGKSIDYDDLKPSNIVFLIDASGSMKNDNKLPLVKHSLRVLLEELGSEDRIAIVAYAGAAGEILPSTPAKERRKILNAMNQLQAGGSTAGGQGIELAYKIAKENLMKNGNNRVVLCTDGDFNVGTSSTAELVRLIEEKRKDDIYLSICGYGMGNYKDDRMEQISNAGNGNYFYIDNTAEAKKVFKKEMRANMFTIAKDVKIQVEFNPNKVKAYRLIGYENRLLADEDFDDDLIDAGELGAGHTVTALYEIVPAGSKQKIKKPADLKYQTSETTSAAKGDEIMNLKFRYKPPKKSDSKLIVHALLDEYKPLKETSDNFRFAAAVAEFTMLLRDSKFIEKGTFDQVIELAENAKGDDPNGYRAEFISLVQKVKNWEYKDSERAGNN